MPARVSANSLRISEAPDNSAKTARRPVPADGSNTTSAGVIAAAMFATHANPIGVENCWRDSLSSDRRVWVGRRLAIFVNIGNMADGDVALARMAAPCRRRNRTVAASQASYAVFQFQAPEASEAPKATSIAPRKPAASMRRPRSRSVKSCRAALTTAEATTAVARIESGAAAEPPRRDSVMTGFLGRDGTGRTARHSPKTATAQILPGPPLALNHGQ